MLAQLEAREMWSANAVGQAFVQAIPNDTSFGQLYGMQKIKAPQAWDISTGNRSVVIADIDSGVDYSHPELYKNIWINQTEIPTDIRAALTDSDLDGVITFWDLNNPDNQGPGKITDLNENGYIDGGDLIVMRNLVDPIQPGGWADGDLTNDGNGYTDDLIGWNFVNNSNNPLDNNGHGTHTAGTIGAMGNNSLGVAGVNWQVQIMPLKFIAGDGSGSLDWAADALRYAVDNGAPVSNNSWAYYGGSTGDVIYQAVDYARTHNHLVVAAAGNDGFNNDKSIWRSYPASFSLSNIISVAATDSRDAKASWSNYGGTSVDLGAPGVNVLSTLPGGGYGYGSGTSMATPHVTGTIGLILAKRPALAAAPNTIKSVLLNTVDKVKSLSGKTVSGGRLNAFAALTTAQTASGASGSFGSEPDGSSPGSGGNPGRGRITGLDESETSLASGVDSGIFGAWSLANDVVNVDENADFDQVSVAEQQRTSLTDNGEPTPPAADESTVLADEEKGPLVASDLEDQSTLAPFEVALS